MAVYMIRIKAEPTLDCFIGWCVNDFRLLLMLVCRVFFRHFFNSIENAHGMWMIWWRACDKYTTNFEWCSCVCCSCLCGKTRDWNVTWCIARVTSLNIVQIAHSAKLPSQTIIFDLLEWNFLGIIAQFYFLNAHKKTCELAKSIRFSKNAFHVHVVGSFFFSYRSICGTAGAYADFWRTPTFCLVSKKKTKTKN